MVKVLKVRSDFASVLVGTVSMFAMSYASAMAAETSAQSATEAAPIEEVVVTGSRIVSEG